MHLRDLVRAIQRMPRAGYIFLRFVLILSCMMLLGSFALFLYYEETRPLSRSVYLTASALLENPAGILILGGIGTVFLTERSR